MPCFESTTKDARELEQRRTFQHYPDPDPFPNLFQLRCVTNGTSSMMITTVSYYGEYKEKKYLQTRIRLLNCAFTTDNKLNEVKLLSRTF